MKKKKVTINKRKTTTKPKITESIWTRFMDMHSGGGSKEKWEYIYIEAPEDEAVTIFYNRFGHNPHRVTCTCCGNDYCLDQGPLKEITAYDRNCDYVDGEYVEKQSEDLSTRKYKTLEEFMKGENVLFIHAKDIKPEERVGEVPNEGYVWV